MLGPHVPDLPALELLVAVGGTGSLSAAAGDLGITQQAASLRLRATERRVGVPLVVRSARAVVAGAGPGALFSLAVADDVALGRLRVVEIGCVDLRGRLRAVWTGAPQLPRGAVRDLVDVAGPAVLRTRRDRAGVSGDVVPA